MAEKMSFEVSLARLEEIVAELEAGQLSLEKALQMFEEGVSLVKICGRQLQMAEKKVARLSRQVGDVLKPIEEEDQEE
jgi:exodeoxyribonuclease VII small subunit